MDDEMATGPFVLLGIAAILCAGGGHAAVHGRLAIRRVGASYHGSAWAWTGYLGGTLLAAMGILALAWSIAWAVMTWMS